MKLALEPAAHEREAVRFEVERFEPSGAERLELSGRWFGVRGRRFVRPTLTIITEASRSRVLADLEHKPWAARDGELWHASFPWEQDGTDVVKVELAVATDIEIALPAPGSENGAAKAKAARRPRGQASGRTAELNRALEDQRGTSQQLAADLERAIAERDDAVRALDQVVRRTEQAARKVDAAARDRDGAIAAREQALAAQEDAVAARDEAIAARDEAISVRDLATAVRDEAIAARDKAIAARDKAIAERDRAINERNQLARLRDEALGARERLRSEARRRLAERDRAIQQLRTQLENTLSERNDARKQLDDVGAASEAKLAALRAEFERARQFRTSLEEARRQRDQETHEPAPAPTPPPTPQLQATQPLPAAPPPQATQPLSTVPLGPPRATAAPPAARPRTHTIPPLLARSGQSGRTDEVDWLRRALALAVLLAVIAALLIVLRLV